MRNSNSNVFNELFNDNQGNNNMYNPNSNQHIPYQRNFNQGNFNQRNYNHAGDRNAYGQHNYNQPSYGQAAYGTQQFSHPAYNRPVASYVNAFPICTTPCKIPDTVNNVSYIPKEKDIVHSDQFGDVTLCDKIGSGGEGSVYRTTTFYVAKIFSKSANTARKVKKIKLLMSNPLTCKGICAPKSLLYNDNHEIVGYLMDIAEGVPLTIFAIPQIFAQKFPNWKKRDLVQLCITILKMINFLHNRNVIIGDLNLENILVKSPTEAYFVDVDSYQIQDLPCTVGKSKFTPPELQKFDFNDILRNPGNENFTIAVLLFHLMVLGQHPYNKKGPTSIEENIRNKAFPYPLGPNKGFDIPDGLWRYMWSHLPANLKKAFFHTFALNGEFTKISKRLSAMDWKHLMEDYLGLLDSGKFGVQDKMSEEIYPTRFKKQPGTILVHCTKCNNEVDEKYCYQGVCLDCRRKESIATGQPMVNPPIQRVCHPETRPLNRRSQAPCYNVHNRLNKLNY